MPEWKQQPLLYRYLLAVTFLVTPACAQEPVTWQDPSKHQVKFVTVEERIRLETFDWGESGRAVVLLSMS